MQLWQFWLLMFTGCNFAVRYMKIRGFEDMGVENFIRWGSLALFLIYGFIRLGQIAGPGVH